MQQRKSIRTIVRRKSQNTEKRYEHVPKGAAENEEIKVFWDTNFLCENMIEIRTPDIIVIVKKE